MNKLCIAIALAWLSVSLPAAAQSPSATLPEVVKRVRGAVVVIRTSGHTIARETPGKVVTVAGTGSGALVTGDGLVVTAAHVVQAADAVAVEFPDGVRVRARIVASDPAADVALLKLDGVPPGASVVKFGNSDKAEVGDQIFVIGAPLGMAHTLTVGHVSARREVHATFGGVGKTELFQTDAAINPGNSGGPMFNMNGEVIGIVSRIMSRSGGSEGLGFVVTSNLAQRLLFEEPTVWSGLEGFLMTPEIAAAFNVPGNAAALLVQGVAEGSPAARLGLRGGTLPAVIGQEPVLLGGDIILSVDGISIGAPEAYEQIRRRMIAAQEKGSAVSVTVLRSGKQETLTGIAVRPR